MFIGSSEIVEENNRIISNAIDFNFINNFYSEDKQKNSNQMNK
jgi:hypothetical protein